jgi:tRNA A-37 threonylcarbamoyl transferase component Bud32
LENSLANNLKFRCLLSIIRIKILLDKSFIEKSRGLVLKNLKSFYKLKSLKISHGDMKADNILIHDDKPFFIDLDSMKWHKRELRFSHAWKKDMKRFMKNWKNSPEVAGLFKLLQG